MSTTMPSDHPAEASPSDWFAVQRARAELSAAALPANKTALFDALARAGITAVIVEFDGAGDSGQIESVTAHVGETPADLPAEDSGQIESVTAHVGETPADLPADAVSIGEPNGAGTGLDHRACPLAEAIETMAYDLLEETQGGWEIDDGAFGTFTFDVAARSVRLAFNARYTDYATSEYSF